MGRWGDRAAAVDVLLAVGVAGLGLVGIALGELTVELTSPEAIWRGVLVVLATLGLAVPLAWRRRAPGAVLTVVGSSTAVIWVLGEPDTLTAIAGSISIYSVGRHLERSRSLRVFGTAAVGLGLVAAWAAVTHHEPERWMRFLSRCAVVAAAFWLGDSQRSRAALEDAWRERARRVEAERAEVERRAVLEERARIARELHDVVAHSLSVMVVQATAASRLVGRDTGRASAAITHVVDVGRSALSEMRSVLGRLDDDPADRASRLLAPDLSPMPTLAELGPLVERCRAAGLTVDLDVVTDLVDDAGGDRDGVLGALPAAVQLAAVRVVQEALTNVLKHAPGAAVAVRLRAVPTDVVRVEVVDGGGDQLVAVLPGEGGRGLVGLRERVEALGGTFEAGPSPKGGFAVRAALPVGGRR